MDSGTRHTLCQAELQPVEGDLGRSLMKGEVNIDTDVSSPFGERVVLTHDRHLITFQPPTITVIPDHSSQNLQR